MRTKALLLTAALSAAGVATSMAQAVFSVNAVGYVNTTIVPGFNLVSNPLTASDNTIATLFKGVPADTAVYKYSGATGFTIASYDGDVGAFGPPAAAALTVVPGEGVFVKNPTSAAFTITFVGQVSQNVGTTPLAHAVPKGLSIQSSEVPQAGTADSLGLVGAADDTYYQFDTTSQNYHIFTYDGDLNAWTPALPALKVGEAFFFKSAQGGTWTRSFSVNS